MSSIGHHGKIAAMNKFILTSMAMALLVCPTLSMAAGNERIATYEDAKKILYKKVYYDHRKTLYCGANFDKKRNVELPRGFRTPEHEKRSHKVEIEHIVPAENFGRAFPEWRDGAPQCVKNGKRFAGRKCAQTNREFSRMEADLHNLAPAIGSVNAVRGNTRFGVLPGMSSTFGSCPMKVWRNTVEPPDAAKGMVARTNLYMADAYPKWYRLSDAQRKLFESWDAMFPPDRWECERAQRIWRVQGNPNKITERRCR